MKKLIAITVVMLTGCQSELSVTEFELAVKACTDRPGHFVRQAEANLVECQNESAPVVGPVFYSAPVPRQ